MAEEQQDTDVEIQDFILSRELAEVYLLMDHISACQCKEIPASLNDDPVFKNSDGRTWLEQICEIAWPPEGTTRRQDARNAARLIRAKDILNKAAAPATGGTIAFTLMMAGEARDPQSGSWWRRTLMWMADAIPKELAAPFGDAAAPTSGGTGAGGTGGTGGTGGGGSGGWGGQPPSRASLAGLAYPSLARRAWQYRVGLYFILGFLVMWLLVTCMLSWDVATGNSLLNRVTTLDARVTTLESAILAPTTTTQQVVVQDPTKLATSTTPPPRPSDLENARAIKARAMNNLATWMEEGSQIRDFLVNRMGGANEAVRVDIPSPPAATGSAPPGPAAPQQETNSEWAAVLLGILASNILPIFYGLLGAGAAVVRSVSHKMRDSLLAPRDIWLAYVQLALGAVIGACIGLFVNSEGDAATTQSGLLGSVPLSASALCFIAGFGVEGVFQALESLIRRVFNLETPRAPQT